MMPMTSGLENRRTLVAARDVRVRLECEALRASAWLVGFVQDFLESPARSSKSAAAVAGSMIALAFRPWLGSKGVPSWSTQVVAGSLEDRDDHSSTEGPRRWRGSGRAACPAAPCSAATRPCSLCRCAPISLSMPFGRAEEHDHDLAAHVEARVVVVPDDGIFHAVAGEHQGCAQPDRAASDRSANHRRLAVRQRLAALWCGQHERGRRSGPRRFQRIRPS